MRLVLLVLALLCPSLSFAGYGWHKSTVEFKPVDESVTNSDVFQDDDDLMGSFVGGTTIYFTMDLHFESASSVPDAKFRFTEPTVNGSTLNAHCSGQEAPSTGVFDELHSFDQVVTLAISAGTEAILTCRGLLEVHPLGGGMFKVQWAQNTANATATTLHRMSSFKVQRVTK